MLRNQPTADLSGGGDTVTPTGGPDDGADTSTDASAPAMDPAQRARCARCGTPLVDRYHLEIAGLRCSRCARIAPSQPGSTFGAVIMGCSAVIGITVGLIGLVVMAPTLAWLPFALLVGPAIGAAVRSGAGPGHERRFQWLGAVLTYFAVNLGVSVATGVFRPLALLLRPIFVLAALLDHHGGPISGLLLYLLLLPPMLWSAWWAASPPPPSPAYSLVRGGANPPRHVLCGACGAGLPPHLATCPGCGAHTTSNRREPMTVPPA
jgi:hypothetical protein